MANDSKIWLIWSVSTEIKCTNVKSINDNDSKFLVKYGIVGNFDEN